MKKYNEKAIKLYEIARDAGLEDIAESIKTIYKVKKEKQSKPIKEWLDASIYVPFSFYQIIRNIRRNEIAPCVCFTTEKEQKEINNIKQEFHDVIKCNGFKNGDVIAKTENEAYRARAWDDDFFTKIIKDELINNGYKKQKIKNITITTKNCFHLAVREDAALQYCDPCHYYHLYEVFKLGVKTEDAKTWQFNGDTEVWVKD